MKKTVILCGVLLALSASLASAAGVNLAWNNCVGGGGVHDMTFACNTNNNASAHTFVASFRAPAGISAYISNEGTVELQSNSTPLPAWWALKGTGQCRNGAATADANFATGPFGCTDLWAGSASGALASYNVGYLQPNRGRMNLVFAVGSAGAAALNADEEYYAFKVLILNTKTIGTGSCAGCSDGVCIVCTKINVVQPNGTPGGNVALTNPAESSFVTWNNPSPETCTGATPTKNTTWGSIKSLYR
jgi:hypothetical protein